MPRGPRPWPNEVRWARDESIMALMVAKRKLRDVIREDGNMTERQQLLTLAEVQFQIFEALRLLQGTVNSGNTQKGEGNENRA